jgi:hypothetical protein
MLENEFLGSWDLRQEDGTSRDAHVIIESIEPYKPGRKREGERVRRFAIRFKGKRKPLLCNPTNAETIQGLYGSDPHAWIGKGVTLYFDPEVRMKGKVCGGIRIRPMIPRGAVDARPLDRPVDQDIRAAQNAAAGREPGEEG